MLRLDAEAQLAQARHEAQLAPVAESMPTTPPRGPRGGLPPETMPMPTMPVMPLPRAAFRRAYLLCFGKMQHAFMKDMKEAFAYFDTDASGSLIMATCLLLYGHILTMAILTMTPRRHPADRCTMRSPAATPCPCSESRLHPHARR